MSLAEACEIQPALQKKTSDGSGAFAVVTPSPGTTTNNVSPFDERVVIGQDLRHFCDQGKNPVRCTGVFPVCVRHKIRRVGLPRVPDRIASVQNSHRELAFCMVSLTRYVRKQLERN